MEFKDIPEPFKTRLEENMNEMGPEIHDSINTSVDSCPDWESAKDSIFNCLQFQIDEARKIQNFISKE